MLTRRALLAGGAAAMATLGAARRTVAQAEVVTRRPIGRMAAADPDLAALRRAVAAMKALPASDPRNWVRFADIHRNFCPHANWYFLPWHRAYLLSYERMIRAVTGNSAFAMPYWDWTANRTVPQAFRDATYGGQPNPLYVAARNNSYSIPDVYSGPAVMSSIYGQTNFELFASSRAPGQNNTNQSWIKARGTQGTLEATPHNNIHVNLGGFMPNGNSPMDPIFLMHHGNIDRIWWSWNCRGRANTTDPLWRTMPFTNNYYNPDGTWATYRPADLLSVTALGYSYGLCLRPLPQILVRDLANLRLAQIFRAGPGVRANVAGVQALRLRSRATGPTFEAVGAAPPRSLRNTFQALARPNQAVPLLRQPQTTSQIVALIHNLTPPSDNVEVLVFAGTGAMAAANSPRDPNFVTSIGFFGAHAHDGHGVSASVDLTEHLRAIGADRDEIHVRLVARAVGRTEGSVQETVGRAEVEVVFV